MPQAKSRNKVGLGNSLMNDRFGGGSRTGQHRATHGITRVGPDGTEYKINDHQEASWVKMRSVTEQGDLDEFLANAELAGTDFTAERIRGTRIIHADQRNPYLLTGGEQRAVARRQAENRTRLTVPRRPPWDEHTTPQQLDERERESLLRWRRGLAELEEGKDLLMTPFERNIEVWRQLWRVIERSDLVVQIVDARNPLLYRSEDLERYVKEVDPRKANLLLVNKADMMTHRQRLAWADYFDAHGIRYKYFSARLAKELNEAGEEEEEHEGGDDEAKWEAPPQQRAGGEALAHQAQRLDIHDEEEEEDEQSDDDDDDDDEEEEDSEEEDTEEESRVNDGLKSGPRVGQGGRQAVAEDMTTESPRTRILTVDELEQLFLDNAPDISSDDSDASPRKTQIGLVGYPNVGKSSTINALVGAKKVSVSSTPGKTKHFQTIHLSERVVLCDCPGLVLPNFATTKAELVVNGILPIDQQREFTGPAGLVAQRIPRTFFEALYGVRVRVRPAEEGGTGVPTADEILRAYAKARGFAAQMKSGWDTSRAARYILKDYVNGRLLWCAPPPRDPPWDERDFNREQYDGAHLPAKRQAQLVAAEQELAEVEADAGEEDEEQEDAGASRASLVDLPLQRPNEGAKSRHLDKTFFAPGRGSAGHLSMPFNHKYSEQGKKQLSGRKAKAMVALEKGVDPSELSASSKKHFKGNRRVKQRRAVGGGGDEDD